ncbi:MAG: hypothetical protein HXY42_14685 [Chloroflexi bacterium]|nr:hypothetical protein [Chloroflexota bacterium]
MEDTPLTKRPWFYIGAWLVILLVVYGWQIARMGGVSASLPEILFDLLCVFPGLLILWMAFFAQFVLPVQTFEDRKKIFSRLLTDLFGGHGPALFIENGEIKEHSGERLKKGPGVVWLDSASAAVTRTAVKIKQTLGPGVHFIESGEYIAGTVDLHIQTQTLGPKENEDPFAGEADGGLDPQMMERRKTVSALTRDGIEVVPNISISFRVDTGFPREGEPGSRFGFRTGSTRRARENEEKDKEAIRKAILGEGINPHKVSEMTRRRVAWNELPASLAVDLWREYASKFTLDELFKSDQLIPSAPPAPPQPAEEEIDPLSQPVRGSAHQTTLQDRFAQQLRKVNVLLSKVVQRLEGTGTAAQPPQPTSQRGVRAEPSAKSEPAIGTALQVINEMVNARLKSPEVPVLDDHGVRGKGHIASPEYQLLQNRGIRVLSVNIGNLRFDKEIERTIIEKWSASWLKNAEAEKKQIERRQNIVRASGQEKAIRQYADLLCNDLLRKKPKGVKETLKTLLMRTRTIILNNDQLRKDMSEEQQMLEDILRWVEAGE